MDDTPKAVTAPPRPTIAVQPRGLFESLRAGGSIPESSSGPMTLSSFFSNPENCSFSQLLAGVSSPLPKANSFLAVDSSSSGDAATGSVSGYKQTRPGSMVVAQSPLFMIPPGLSPSGLLNSPGFLSPGQSPLGMSHQQALAHVTAQAALSLSYMQQLPEIPGSSEAARAEALKDQSFPVPNENLQRIHKSEIIKTESPEISQINRKPVASVEKLENDGYNWRKYGQKQVKASECPRSYYRCTHLNCDVKKKVERSLDGHITEITYKSQHNHDRPQPSGRAKDGLIPARMSSSQVKPPHNSLGQADVTCTPISTAHGEGQLPSQSSSEHLAVTTEGGGENPVEVNEDAENNQPNAKRICMEAGASSLAPSRKTVVGPRKIVQTKSEVDLLDDGYKWRKYGQKVVKGNANPRSYYRCTHAGCNVRKHVERASTDPKAVITTYEGEHNHETSTAKSSCTPVLSKSQKRIRGKPALHAGIDYDSKDQIPVLVQLKEGEIAA